MHAKAGEADRAIRVKMVGAGLLREYDLFTELIRSTFPLQPKHLFAGKRKMGKTDRR